MLTLAWLVALLVVAVALAYVNASGIAWTVALAVALGVAWVAHLLPAWLTLALAVAFVLLAIPLNVTALRRKLISDGVLARVPQDPAADVADRARGDRGRHRLVGRRPLLRQARLEASSSPCRRRRSPPEEQRFLDDETEELCAMVTDWETTNVHRDLPPHVWQYIKDKGFLGMIIPKEYGGLGLLRLRALAGDDQAVDALAAPWRSRVMVPNSLGPGRAARCTTAPTSRSATTCRASPRASRSPASRSPTRTRARTRRRSPTTASSAGASTRASSVLGLRVTWDKRYITLGPVATLLGLAFRAYDPDHLRRRQGGHRHHLRADPDVAPGRARSAAATCR